MVLCMCCAGLMVQERNWLDVYPYANWGGRDALPVFQEGQSFMPHELLLQDVRSASSLWFSHVTLFRGSLSFLCMPFPDMLMLHPRCGCFRA